MINRARFPTFKNKVKVDHIRRAVQGSPRRSWPKSWRAFLYSRAVWQSTSHWGLPSYGICYGSQGPIRNSPAHLSIWRSCLLLVSSCVTKWPYHLDIYGKMLLVILICLQTLRKWPYRNQSGSVVRNTGRECRLSSKHPHCEVHSHLYSSSKGTLHIWTLQALHSDFKPIHRTHIHSIKSNS